ncbi:hypothetical protein BD770DRAFT_393960 [Pilaira anomala]|nr:hypothetical protein BD770DRAFT_393960 [Pilaira anomala]
MSDNNSLNNRPRKPKPLFGLFRKNKPGPVQVIVPTSPSYSVPLHSILSPHNNIERLPKTSMSDTRNPILSPQFQQRPRSKSVGRDPSAHIRLMEERESALNKLCQREINSPTSSLVDSLPLLSPTYSSNNPPPVPPIPFQHKPTMRKFSSAHDLQKVAKLQQDSINQAHTKPLPKRKDLSRSRSLNNTLPKVQQQQLRSPLTPTVFSRHPRWPPIRNDDNSSSSSSSSSDDDNIPLGYLQSPISKPSSLLSDNDDEDDEDLVPIAKLNTDYTSDMDYQTAADKYKEKVKERLQLDDDTTDDDDDIPISLLSSKNLYNKKPT